MTRREAKPDARTTLELLGLPPESMPPFPYTRAGSWPRPKSVKCQVRNGTEIIVVSEPDFAALDNRVQTARDLLARFIHLEQASGAQIADFAAQFGCLGDDENAVQPGPAWWDPEIQRADTWRWWASRASAGLDLLVALRSGKVGNPQSWREFTDSTPPWARGRYEGEEVAVELARMLGFTESPDRARNQFSLFLNITWLNRVAPRLVWDDEATFEIYAGSVIGAVGMQLVVGASGRQRWARCVECTAPITPERVYDDGRANYCRPCRKSGAPQRRASRRYRNKKRKEQSNG